MGYPELAAMNISHRYYSIESFFEAAHRAGYRNVELWTGSMHLYVDNHGFDPIDRVRGLMECYGIRIVGICPEQNNPKPWNVAARDKRAQERTRAYFEHVIDLAVELGAPQILVTGGWAFLDEPVEGAWERSVVMLRAITDYAQRKGIRVAIEALQPVESILVNSAHDMRRMIDDVGSPVLKGCIDMGAMAVAGDTFDSYFDELGDDIAHVHFVDIKEETTHLAWGDGSRDMRADLDALVRRGYRGVVSAETYDSRYFADPALALDQVMREYRRAVLHS